MRVHIAIALLLAVCAIFFKGGGETKRSRKHYGLSYHSGCKDYIKTFTCMTACKSIGYQVFRLDFRCKCTCHELKTTTILPFFKWRTNGTTRAWVKTSSPSLYHIYGTLSPATYSTTENLTTLAETTEPSATPNPCETPKSGNDTSDSGVTSNPGNDTSSGDGLNPNNTGPNPDNKTPNPDNETSTQGNETPKAGNETSNAGNETSNAGNSTSNLPN
ncbi:uncharacterized protein LOC111352710 [Spodoptera litura]|uniref:Uncharacterized protein LOC111352710 n=1 Tax=Spodoptera litura TaxID=69820 RepID=A0A9J7E4I4_SPOLT|nr:uncharacterized protein LOC111352710 [Spodoptera litura]